MTTEGKDGVLVVNKPKGWTSHDAVARVKKTLAAQKVGHLGTLDPAATGVLPLVVNRATRFARWLELGKKVYRAVLTLGIETDTYDLDGTVIARREVGRLSEEEIRAAFSRFVGRIKQTPPMYSSVKRGGVPLYKLARKGVTVERRPKEVEIYSLRVIEINLPEVTFEAVCSKGTYIRTLCKDIGDVLGTGAVLSALVRTASGEFTLDDAVDPTLDRASLLGALIPLGHALVRISGHLPALTIGDGPARTLFDGARVRPSEVALKGEAPARGELVSLVNRDAVVAVAQFNGRFFTVKKAFGPARAVKAS